jgi:hypothetical protein
LSGHSWSEQTPLSKFEVVSHTGIIATCRSQEKAEKIAAEWQEFYNNMNEAT